MTKKYDNSSSLQQKLIEGIDILADNVASTLGPRGRNVIIHSAHGQSSEWAQAHGGDSEGGLSSSDSVAPPIGLDE